MNFHKRYELLCLSKQYPMIIDIAPKSAPRPKGGNHRMPASYKNYKKDIVEHIKVNGGFPKGNYWAIDMEFYFPYPAKNNGKKWKEGERIEGAFYRAVNDTDNLFKGVMDSLEDGEFIGNDREIIMPFGAKYRTRGNGFMQICLFALPDEKMDTSLEMALTLIRQDYADQNISTNNGEASFGFEDPFDI